jgi:hypothetical protein
MGRRTENWGRSFKGCRFRPTWLAGTTLIWLASAPTTPLAQELLPPAGEVPRHAVVDVATLPRPGAPAVATMRAPRRRLRPDPETLARFKARLVEPGADSLAPSRGEAGRAIAPADAATVTSAFEGLTNNDNNALTGFVVVPPDPNLGVGPSHVFQMVNIAGRITDKSGVTASTFALADFFALDAGADETDPRVIFDAQSGRWFATYLQLVTTGQTGSSSIVLAASATSDPTGAFCLYRLGNPTAETFVQDFPQVGVSADKVVVTYNGFSFAGSGPFIGAGYYAVNKADLAACSASPHVVRSTPKPSRFSLHPVQTLDATSTLYMALHDSTTGLTVIALDGVPGASPVMETPTPRTIRSWVAPPNAVQPSSSVLLDTGDDGVLSGAFRNSSLWVAGNEGCTPAGDTQVRSCVRVIEFRTDTMSVRQDSTLAASGQYYYYPALRPDGEDNVLMVFNASSATDFAGLRASGRRAGDPLDSFQAPALLRAGGGAQTTNSGRMGDYSGAAVDPVDPSTVWVHGEYIRATGLRNWGTYVAALTFASPPPTAALAIRKTAGSDGQQFGPGDRLQVDLTISNPGPERAVDAFFGVIPPATAGPALGCPANDPIVLFGSDLTTPVLRCLSSPPQSFPALASSAALPANLAPLTVENFFGLVWPAAPAGTYTFFFVLTTPGALAGGAIAPSDLLAVGTATAVFSP